jgi:hypothetical protein
MRTSKLPIEEQEIDASVLDIDEFKLVINGSL